MTVRVLDLAGNEIRGASAYLRSATSESGDRLIFTYAEKEGALKALGVPPGDYALIVEAPGFEPRERAVEIGRTAKRAIVVLGAVGMPYYYRGSRKIYVSPQNSVFGLVYTASADEDSGAGFSTQWQDSLVEVPQHSSAGRMARVHVYEFLGHVDEDQKQELLKDIYKDRRLKHFGPIINSCSESVTFLTNQLVVRFEASLTAADVTAIATQHALTVMRPLQYAPNTYLLTTGTVPDFGLLDTGVALLQDRRVRNVEPNIVTTPSLLSVDPTDYLSRDDAPGSPLPFRQWHVRKIELPEAWQELRDLSCRFPTGSPGDLTFGSNNVTIAIMDHGIQSDPMGTEAIHPDFHGRLYNGEYKIRKFFDFARMTEDNAVILNSHGTRVSGLAGALVNNCNLLSGAPPIDCDIVTEGAVGAAPNVALMSLILPSGCADTELADAFLWAAGLDPGNWAPGAPPPPDPGADIISNSYYRIDACTPQQPGLPMAIELAFEKLTNEGRKGNGTLIFFSAGRYESDNDVRYVMAAADETIAVGATTKDDQWSGTSNCGSFLDISAPAAPITTDTVHDDNNLWGHPDYDDTDPQYYTWDFGGTSAAAPLAAGVAALVLSVNNAFRWDEVRNILQETAESLNYLDLCDSTTLCGLSKLYPCEEKLSGVNDRHSQYFGYGRINAFKAVKKARELSTRSVFCYPTGSEYVFVPRPLPYGTLTPHAGVSPGFEYAHLSFGADLLLAQDIDQDGDTDILAMSKERRMIGGFENRANMPFGPMNVLVSKDAPPSPFLPYLIQSSLTHTPHSFTAGDIDGDALMDLVVSYSDVDSRLEWYRNAGANSPWTSTSIGATPQGATSVLTGDIDADEDLDVIVVETRLSRVVWYEHLAGDASGWTSHEIPVNVRWPKPLQVGDIDNDGALEIVTASSVDSEIVVMKNIDGAGRRWSRAAISTTFAHPDSLVLADMDGDGDEDILTSSSIENRMSWYENDGAANVPWREFPITTTLEEPYVIRVIDFDCDDDLDILAASGHGVRIVLYKNIQCNPDKWLEYHLADSSFPIVSAIADDLDGDADIDFIASGPNAQEIQWLENVSE